MPKNGSGIPIVGGSMVTGQIKNRPRFWYPPGGDCGGEASCVEAEDVSSMAIRWHNLSELFLADVIDTDSKVGIFASY